ncbi:hypothetical protein CAN33_003000 [Aspergillus niger]|uniref:Uncharacterized protein n=1 Tax=Aspergillus niger TaxID=5061 RepID=A0A505HW89_ASPNG|nr:hypothetical protein CAN33_003000 [Aspergillus niger]
MTPELIWRLRISKRSQSLRLRWEPENLDTPLLRRLERTPYGFRLHKSLLMTYDSSQRALQELGRDARFEEDIGHYNYRRWTGNGVNRNVTSQERQRVLGQSGDAVFEKHYQSQFIGRDLQHVVLLRPPQEGLLQLAGSMPRKRNLFGLSSQLTNAQRRAICQTGTVEKAQELFAHLHERNEEKGVLGFAVIEVSKQIKRLLGPSVEGDGDAADSSEEDDWELPIPDYVFPERARLVESFYGSKAENFDEDKLLARRIQVTKDMVALSKLCEPDRRGKRINWGVDVDSDQAKSGVSFPTQEGTLECPTNVCNICYGLSRASASNPPPHQFPSKRMDSLRRHLIDSHLALVDYGISCNWAACRDVPRFAEVTAFLAHAVKLHAYDVNIKLHHLPERFRLPSDDSLCCESTDSLLGSGNQNGSESPTPSVSSELANIDPRLLNPCNATATATVANPPLRRSNRLRGRS